ncbi:hypothetical protein SUGI_0909830 [Cryptomeria japonica]|nr:hypothetical protein SUGI_0909830 [Cryptomeria japonica]
MAVPCISYFLLSVFFIVIMLHAQMLFTAVSAEQDTKLHVVYMGSTDPAQENGESYAAAAALHLEMLHSVHGSREAAEESLKNSYWKSFGGFAAMLSSAHVEQLLNMDGVVSVFESKKLQPLTTRSWDFIGFPASAQRNNLDYQSDIIIGVIDTGIWPESESFSDAGFGSIPSKWRGGCQTTPDFPACNKKLVGAKFFRSVPDNQKPVGDFLSPRDVQGHGTHTSSTAAGNHIYNASLYGIAQGDARGGIPGARIAMYKVCWIDGCTDADMLAAFDDAIHDNVDVISISIGTNITLNYFEDSIAIGAFHAMKRGILVSNSAGNSGPDRATISNYSPWSLTVAASTIDRKMTSELILGNGMFIEGIAVNTYTMEQLWYPLVYGGDVANVNGGFTSKDSSNCKLNSLDHTKVKGKIVLCNFDVDRPDYSVFIAGGVGVIIMLDNSNDIAYVFLNPTTVISTKQGQVVLSYINSISSPMAKIQKTTTTKARAPIVASFSSRGYNPITFDILKPDITAPGVDIFASWPKNSSLSEYLEDTRFGDFNILSGTSMSCPHATGAIGFVKSYHQNWSPAAIKSALMTTAFVMDPTLDETGDAEFGYGAGQINPMKAINPGLVYNTSDNIFKL